MNVLEQKWGISARLGDLIKNSHRDGKKILRLQKEILEVKQHKRILGLQLQQNRSDVLALFSPLGLNPNPHPHRTPGQSCFSEKKD